MSRSNYEEKEILFHVVLLRSYQKLLTLPFQTILMQPYRVWHLTTIIISILLILFITYTSMLLHNFSTPETTNDFFRNSNTYYYVAEIVKTDIRNHYPMQLRNNVIQLTLADTLLNVIVSPTLVEHLALPVIRVRTRIAHLPLSFAEHNIVLNTSQYTQNVSTT